MNRVAADAAFDYGYDDEGNLTSRVERATGEVTAFAYDHRDRLTGSERRSAGGVLLTESRSTYDVFDRLIVRTAGGVATATVYDGVNPWADAAAGGAVTARYLYGDGADEVLARWTPAGGQAWSLADKQGTVRDLIDAAGAVVGTRSYDAFGRILAESGAVDRFAFQGREWDAGAGLYQFRARWYDPATRQFTSADPLGFAAGDWNTRRFAANNPLSGTDPSGKLALTERAVLPGAIIGASVSALCSLADMIALNDFSASAWVNLVVNSFSGAAVGTGFGLLLVGTSGAHAIAIGLGVIGVGLTGLERYGALREAQAAANRPGGNNGLIFAWAACTIGQLAAVAVAPRVSRWVARGTPNPGVKPPSQPKVPPPKGGGCFLAGTLVLAEAVIFDADAGEVLGVVESIGDWLGTDDGRWAVAALLLAGLASWRLGGPPPGTPTPVRNDDESEPVEDGCAGADEFGRWHWKR